MEFINFSEYLRQDRDITHIKNMILVAIADNDFKSNEVSAILAIMSRMGVSKDRFNEVCRQLVSEKKVKEVGSQLIPSGNVLSNIEVVVALSLEDKIKYLQDYVFVMMADGTIDRSELAFCRVIADEMGVSSNAVNVLIHRMQKMMGTQEELNHSSSKDNSVSHTAKKAIRIILTEVNSLLTILRTQDEERRFETILFCTSMAFRCGHIDKKNRQEIVGYIVSSEGFNDSFVKRRLEYYGSEIQRVLKEGKSCKQLYDVIYLHPLYDNPNELPISKVEDSSQALKDFYSAIVQMSKTFAAKL